MTESLEVKARRIGDDVTAVWDEIRAKGGMIPHHINTENLIDVLKQIVGINKWGSHGAFFYTPDGFYDFYTTHEVNRMEELPEAPAGLTWRISLADLKTRLENNTYVVVASDGTYEFDTSLHLNMTDANYRMVELYIDIDGDPEDVEIMWGDGEISIAQAAGPQFFSHTYATTGEYDLAFKVNGHTDIIIKPHRNNSTPEINPGYGSNMFGKAWTTPNDIGAKVFSYITSAIVGPKTTFGMGAFHPGAKSTSVSQINSSNLTNVFYTYNPTELVSLTKSPITEYVMPNSAEEFTNGNRFQYCGPFTACSNLTSVTPSENFHTIPAYCFMDTNLSSFDFSHITDIWNQAFNNVPLVGVVDMSTVQQFHDVNWGVLTDNSTTTSIILGNEVDYPQSDAINNRNSTNSHGPFENLTALEHINIPTNWIALPIKFIYNSEVDVSALDFPHELEYICYGALQTKKYVPLADILSRLPSTVKFIGGLGTTSWEESREIEDLANVSFPASLEELGAYSLTNRKLKNLTLPSTLKLDSRALYGIRLPEDTFHVLSTWTIDTYQPAFNNFYVHKLVIDGSNALFSGAFNSLLADEISFNTGFAPTNLNSAFRGVLSYHTPVKITIPSSLTTLNTGEFGGTIGHIVFEGQVPSMPANMFQNIGANSLVIDMTNCVSVPSVTNTSFGSSNVNRVEVIVPDALYASWVADTNWAYLISNKGLNVVKASEA